LPKNIKVEKMDHLDTKVNNLKSRIEFEFNNIKTKLAMLVKAMRYQLDSLVYPEGDDSFDGGENFLGPHF
jgi:hypothetical protein